MYITGQSSIAPDAGPAVFYGYCHRSKQFRMMDMTDFADNTRQSYEQWQRYCEQLYRAPGRHGKKSSWDECCVPKHDCRCECCVCDADVLVHARCGERRLVSLTFENDTRRDRDVRLTLGDFSTASGTALGWPASLSTSAIKLGPCAHETVSLQVDIDCGKLTDGDQPRETKKRGAKDSDRMPDVERCEVGYATVRAEGCISRPIVVAVAVLPRDCDAYHAPCSCDCC